MKAILYKYIMVYFRAERIVVYVDSNQVNLDGNIDNV